MSAGQGTRRTCLLPSTHNPLCPLQSPPTISFAHTFHARSPLLTRTWQRVLAHRAAVRTQSRGLRAALETGVTMTHLALALVMAGTGDLEILRRLRVVRGPALDAFFAGGRDGSQMRTTAVPPGWVLCRPQLHGKAPTDATYGYHMAVHTALGFLFLSGGTASLGACAGSPFPCLLHQHVRLINVALCGATHSHERSGHRHAGVQPLPAPPAVNARQPVPSARCVHARGGRCGGRGILNHAPCACTAQPCAICMRWRRSRAASWPRTSRRSA